VYLGPDLTPTLCPWCHPKGATDVVKGTPYIQPAIRTDYETPTDLFDALWEEVGGFTFDPCCTPDQYTAQRVLNHGTPVRDGVDYRGRICIPPPAEHERYQMSSDAVASRILIDGLAQPWHGKVFMNSPYGLALRKWVPKAVHEVECGNAELVVALVPAKTDTQWWQEYVLTRARFEWDWHVDAHTQTTDVRFLKGRLTFRGETGPAGHASAIVVWRR
jgi:hypothetical protein